MSKAGRQAKLTNDIGKGHGPCHRMGGESLAPAPAVPPLTEHLLGGPSPWSLLLFMALFALLFMGVHFKRYEHLLRHMCGPCVCRGLCDRSVTCIFPPRPRLLLFLERPQNEAPAPMCQLTDAVILSVHQKLLFDI